MEMDGVGMMIIPMRVFTLKKHPCKVEGKDLVKQVIELQLKLNAEKTKEEEEKNKQVEEEAAAGEMHEGGELDQTPVVTA